MEGLFIDIVSVVVFSVGLMHSDIHGNTKLNVSGLLKLKLVRRNISGTSNVSFSEKFNLGYEGRHKFTIEMQIQFEPNEDVFKEE